MVQLYDDLPGLPGSLEGWLSPFPDGGPRTRARHKGRRAPPNHDRGSEGSYYRRSWRSGEVPDDTGQCIRERTALGGAASLYANVRTGVDRSKGERRPILLEEPEGAPPSSWSVWCLRQVSRHTTRFDSGSSEQDDLRRWDRHAFRADTSAI